MDAQLAETFWGSRICTPKPQLAMCTACLKGHYTTQHTDAFPRRNCADFSGLGRALKGREIGLGYQLF
jgi:hypothetical protein